MDMNLILKLTRAHLPARGRRHRYRRHRAAAAGMSAVLAMQAAAPVAYGQGAPTFSATQAADAASNAVAQPGAVETRVAQTIQALAQAREAGGARQDARASLDGQFLRSQAQAQANVLVQQGVQWANETGLPWLRRLEGNVSYDFSGRDVAVDVRTIDALHLDQDRALLLQLGGHNQNHRPTVNAGVVARSAAGSSLILGGNAFLDYEVGKRHLRGSLGAEAVAPQFTLYGNVYAPLSGWKAAKRAERREERPAAGWDVGLTARPEAVQGLALNAQYFRWRGAQVDYFDDGRYRRNPSGFKYGIEYRPVPLIGVGVEQARLQSGERQTSVQLGVRLNLGEPLSRQLRRGAQDTAPPFDSGARLQDFVRRENRIVLDTRRKKIVLALRIAEVRTDPATGRITVYGVTEPLADVQLWLPDGTATSVRANAAGGFEASSAGDMTSGLIRARSTDRYGDTSQEVTYAYTDTVDKTAPVLSIAGVATDEATGRVTVTGRSEPDAQVTIRFPGGGRKTVRADANGAYRVRSDGDLPAGVIVVQAADAAGNSTQAQQAYQDTVDRTAPEPVQIALDTDAATGRLTVSGQAEPGASVRVTFPDGETVTVTAKADGTYTATSRADMIGGNVTVVATDAAGNAAAPVRAAYADTVDRTPPVLDTPVLSVASDSGRVTVTGVTEPGARVQVAIPGEAPQTVTADSAGRYRAVSPGDVLQSGTVRVIATDAHGNASAPRDVPYQDAVDRTAPPLTIDAAVEQARTGVVNVSGKTEPNLMVSATFPDGQTAQARADGQGRYQLASPADVARSGRIAVSASDAAGNRAAASAEFTDQVDKTAPRAPTLQLATDTATGRVTASGKAEPGATVEITWPDQTRVTVVADTSGAYSATSAADMPDGAITAVAADRAGNTGAPTRQRYIDSVDRTAPTLGTPSVSTAADTGRVSVTGMTEPGARVQVEIPGEAPRIVTADAAGRYSVVSAGDVLQSGTVRVTATDAYGNASAPVHLPYQDQVDKTAPASPSLTVREDAASGRATVTGQAEPGAAVRVVFPNGEAQTVTAGSDGAYSVTSAADMVAGEITAVAADASGNQSAPARTVFADAVDKTAPAAPTLALNEAAASGRLTVSGRTEPGASVRVTFPDGETVTVTAKADGTYTATSRADMIGGNVTVVATDTAGNAAAPVRAAYADTVDRTPPVLDTPVLSVASDSGRVTVTGVTEPGARVQVAIPGEAPQTVTADSAGRYRAVSPGDVLQSGTVRVIATDAHGNASAPRDVPYQDAVDRTAPPLTIDAAVEQARTGVVNVSGKTEPNLMVSATFPDGQTAQARADGQGRYQLASPADVARSGRIAVSVSDAAGNRAAASAEFTDQVDKTAPAVTIRAVTEQAGTGVATVSGTTEPGATVSVTFPDGQVARATADRSGAYTVHSARDVTARGNISVVATDAAGNASPSVSRQFSNTVADMVPPSLTIAMVTTDPSDGRITVSGVTEAGARVHVVFPGGASDTVTADSKGGYRATSAGDVGSGAVTAQATDASANRSPLKTYAYTDAWQPRKLSAKDFGQSRYFVPLSTRGGTDNEPLLRITNQQIPTAELRVALKPYKTEDRAGRLVREAIELKWGDAPGVGGDARALHFYVPASAKAKLRKELTDVERSNDYKFWIEFTDTRFGGVARLYIKVISTL
ncbi:Ig-like domain-containing protein [Bordetella bronchiseptica]